MMPLSALRLGSAAKRRRRCPGRPGFTLIEVMLAITIFAGVLAAIYSCWSSILRSSRIAQAAAAQTQRNRIAARSLEDALLGAQMFFENAKHYAFLADTAGSDAALSFVSRLPDSFPRSGKFGGLVVRRVEFTVERDHQGEKTLVVRQNPILFEPDVDEQQNPLVLASGIDSFTVEFWGMRSNEWEPEWLVTNQLPRRVRFALVLNAPSATAPGKRQTVMRDVMLPSDVGGVRSRRVAPVAAQPQPPAAGPANPEVENPR